MNLGFSDSMASVSYTHLDVYKRQGTTAGGYYTGVGYPPYEGLACGFAYTSGRIAGTSAVKYVNSLK